jgi:hypothetical protein
MTVLYPKGFELANFKVTAKIVWKEPYWKEDLKRDRSWKGYQYGLEFIQILDEDHSVIKDPRQSQKRLYLFYAMVQADNHRKMGYI